MNKHDPESEGSKPRDHVHHRGPYWKRAHLDWRLWLIVVLLISMIVIYVATDNLSLRPGNPDHRQMPEAIAP